MLIKTSDTIYSIRNGNKCGHIICKKWLFIIYEVKKSHFLTTIGFMWFTIICANTEILFLCKKKNFICKHLAVLSAHFLSNSMLYFTYFTWFKWSIPRVQTTCTKEPSITLPVQVPQTQTQLPHLLSHYYYSFKLNPTRLVSLFRSFIKQ